MEEPRKHGDEIDLSTYVKLIIKRKKIIVIIFLASVIGTGISCLLTPRTYEATALILIVPSKIDTYLDTSKFSLDVSTDIKEETANSLRPAMALATHKMLLTSGAVMERVINNLNLTDKESRALHVEDLLNKIKIKEEEQTSIFQLLARDKDPKVAMNLANAWAQEYIQYSGELISGEIKGTSDFVTDQFAIAQKSLYDSEQKIAAFNNQYKIDLMQAELNMKKGRLNSYKTDLLNLEIGIKTQEDLLKELKTQITNENQFIVTSKAMSDDVLWQETAEGNDSGDLGKMKLKSESVNPIYEDLKSRIINTRTELYTNRLKVGYLREQIISTGNDINGLEKTLNQKQIESDQLTRELQINTKNYDNLSTKIEEARMAKAAELGEVKLVSPAYQPQHSVSRNTVKNMLLTGIIALILAVFFVFIREACDRV